MAEGLTKALYTEWAPHSQDALRTLAKNSAQLHAPFALINLSSSFNGLRPPGPPDLGGRPAQ